MANQLLSTSKSVFGNVGNRLNSVLDRTEVNLSSLLDNPYIAVSFKVFLGLYAAFVAPQVPKNFALFMDSTVVRVIFAALIVYSALKDPVTAILLSIVFIITLQTASRYKLYSTTDSVLSAGGISWLPSAKQGAVLGDKPQFGNAVMGGVQQVGSGVMGGVQNLGSGALGSFQQLGGGVVSGVHNMGTGLVGGAQQFGSGFLGGVSELGEGVLGGVRNVGSGLAGGVQQVGSGVLGGFTNLGSCLVDSAQQIGSGLVGGASQFGSGLVGGVQELGEGVIDSSRQFGGGLVGGVQQMGSGVAGGLREMGGGLMGGVQQIGSGVSGGVRSVGSSIGLEHLENPSPANSCGGFAPFTSDQQFENAESNLIQGSDQNSCVQSFQNQYCIQGNQTNWVQGY